MSNFLKGWIELDCILTGHQLQQVDTGFECTKCGHVIEYEVE